jgi:alpha-amylase
MREPRKSSGKSQILSTDGFALARSTSPDYIDRCMSQVCLYFQVHQPNRLRRYSVFDTDSFYFDDLKNAEICRKVAHKCYIPATRTLVQMVRNQDVPFKVAFSLSGTAIEQFKQFVPEVLELFVELATTGRVEFLAETQFHTLASIYSPTEFRKQVAEHSNTIFDLFGQRPTTFRNTELIYSNQIAQLVNDMGYKTILAEGAPQILGGSRVAGVAYHPPGLLDVKVLLKNYQLSDDIAFRFSNRNWSQWPLTADKFAASIEKLDQPAVNLFMDYETFGEHQWEQTGIFEFLKALPAILVARGHSFVWPGELSQTLTMGGELDVRTPTSWADSERDVSAWIGNAMQSNAAHELYKLEQPILAKNDPVLLADWRKLQSSDHFYYMCTKYFADGDVHKYFSPYDSPYDSYINFMNVLDNLRTRAAS